MKKYRFEKSGSWKSFHWKADDELTGDELAALIEQKKLTEDVVKYLLDSKAMVVTED